MPVITRCFGVEGHQKVRLLSTTHVLEPTFLIIAVVRKKPPRPEERQPRSPKLCCLVRTYRKGHQNCSLKMGIQAEICRIARTAESGRMCSMKALNSVGAGATGSKSQVMTCRSPRALSCGLSTKQWSKCKYPLRTGITVVSAGSPIMGYARKATVQSDNNAPGHRPDATARREQSR